MYTASSPSCVPAAGTAEEATTTVALRREMEAASGGRRRSWMSCVSCSRLRTLPQRDRPAGAVLPQLFRAAGFDPPAVTSVADLRRAAASHQGADPRAHRSAEAPERPSQAGALQHRRLVSGEPLIFFIGKERVSHDVAAKWRATRWWDVDIGDPEIVSGARPSNSGAQDRVRRVRDKVLRTELLPAFEMSRRQGSTASSHASGPRPRMLFGYPSALTLIARTPRSAASR
jgi:phenylacetate-CoA ligase